MRKLIPFIFVCALCLGFAACGGDDDEEEEVYFRIKEASEYGKSTIYVTVDNDVLMTTLSVETNLKDWGLVKEDTREYFWSFEEDIASDLRTIKGSGNKTVNIYFIENTNQQDRAAHLDVLYGDNVKRTIVLTQKGIGSAN
ncbi:hypothetical protein M2451_001974 [Dysgonomonas sp. PFB1-18]|uniref:hypothetical protein n=1 Tax=unclassified Dysgonomonas TaxID=2630389 RepID=UPI00247386A4|nr:MULTISPECIES: hypothetical protein [unclassified Dysgonomonas]MDH6309608.1 hypothetical protein [Dysgonomonas sp. PF1-14]MDH6339064.1 hypothetical protein [Dysgonomonas sp. PF1-16]MDH6380650.1 hypothetical protein [Dysgonomonas sp. PFB1-18]MDH6398146.1 hypothetical protein [Dysgonomonas sp. PF1-23]